MHDDDRAARIRLLVLDVDGVLTDNGVYLGLVDAKRVEFKRFDIQDGLGLALMRDTGIEVAWLSARSSDATLLRAEELRVTCCIQSPQGGKLGALQQLLVDRGLSWDTVAFVGDDLADLAVLRQVGWAVAVANAVDEVKDVAHWITSKPGGYGAVREVIERLLRAQGAWEPAVSRYLAQHGGAA